MSNLSDPGRAQASYQPGHWYTLHGHDWQFSTPIDVPEGEPDFPPGAQIHRIRLFLEYGTCDEPAREEGILSTFGYLLRNYLTQNATPAAELDAPTASLDTPNPASPNPGTGPQQLAQELAAGVPRITVITGKSITEIEAAGTNVQALARAWAKLAAALERPDLLYRSEQPLMGGSAAAAVADSQLVPQALLKRREVATGTLWHNDLMLRTGPNGATLGPFDLTHSLHQVFPALSRLIHHLSPVHGAVRHTFQATDPALMGVAFSAEPLPMSAEEFLAQSEARALAFSQAGSLETDDAQALMSTIFPLTPSGLIARDVFGQIVAQLLHEVVGARAELRGEAYLRGSTCVLTLAASGDWSTEDARLLLGSLCGVSPQSAALDQPTDSPSGGRKPADDEEFLPDQRLGDFIEAFTFSDHDEHLLWMHRVQPESVTPAMVRQHIRRAIESLHIPEPVARGELAVMFPPLVPEHLLMGHYGSGQGAAFPSSLEIGDISRSFHAVEGQNFACRIPSKPGEFAFFAPHRLTVSDEFIVQEWYEDTRPGSALCRRLAVAWDEVRAWVSIGEAIALVDHAGRALFVIPTVYDRVGELYEALREFERVVARQGAVLARGGDYELREVVRGVVAQQAAREVRVKAEADQHSLASNGNPVKAAKAMAAAQKAAEAAPPLTTARIIVWSVCIAFSAIGGYHVLQLLSGG